MEYFQNDMLSYFVTKSGIPVHKIAFHTGADKEENKAALNFHLTKREEMTTGKAFSSCNSYWQKKHRWRLYRLNKVETTWSYLDSYFLRRFSRLAVYVQRRI